MGLVSGEAPRGLGEASRTDCGVYRGPSQALWTLPGFYNGLYLPRRPKERPLLLPVSLSLSQSSCYLLLCLFFFLSVSKTAGC